MKGQTGTGTVHGMLRADARAHELTVAVSAIHGTCWSGGRATDKAAAHVVCPPPETSVISTGGALSDPKPCETAR